MRLLVCVAAACAAAALPAFGAGNLHPTDLTSELQSDPFGLGEPHPRLGWRLEADDPAARGLAQSAYEIRVAGSPEALKSGAGALWDTGEVMSGRTAQIDYAGPALISRERCWWTVRVWDQGGNPSDWSPASRWTMGLLEPSDWSAQWIGQDPAEGADGTGLTDAQRARLEKLPLMTVPVPESRTSPVAAFVRRGFTLPEGRPVRKVTFAALPDNRCLVSVNGRPVSEIDRWEPVTPLDLTADVVSGDNVIAIQVIQEDGYRPDLQGELDIEFADGTTVQLPIDPTWHFAAAARPGWDAAVGPEDDWSPLETSTHHARINQFHFLSPAPFLRRDFTVEKPVRRATVYATALGDYELHINGQRVGHDYLTPGWTDYTRRVPYQAYDVGAMLRPGANAIGAILGDGWYAGTVGNVEERHYYGGYPRLLAQLEIEYEDGSVERVVTDGSWRAAFGPVRFADNMLGYAYDARLEFGGWAGPGFDASSWSPPAVGLRRLGSDAAPAFVLEADTIPPVRVTDELPARKITQPAPGVYLVDFGQNMAGWVRLRVNGRAGQRITVRHGEMLNSDGTLYTTNLRGATATDTYWLRGGAPETLEPRFTFHGFRYAQITGLDSAPAPDAVTALAAGTPIRRTGEFTCSDPLVNQLFHNIIWSQKGNYLETPTDCPQRDERLGWSGDAQFFIRTGAFNFDVALFIERWLQAMRDGQSRDGTFYDVAPAVSAKSQRAITAWGGDAAIICTEALWRVYGDRRAIEKNYDALSRYMAWLEVSNQHGVSSVGGYEDWVNLGGGAKPEVIDTAYYSHLCGLMSEMAAAIGRPSDADRFSRLQARTVAAFQRAFLRPDGSIVDSSQTAYALAFTMNLLPDSLKAAAAAKFVEEIASRNWHLATGFIGTPRLLPALHLAGRDDVAYRLLLQDTFPSWLFPVKEGATSMWERWDGWTPDKGFESIGMNSFNHYSFGSVGEFLYRFVAGIDTDGPGFRRILIQPRPGGTLTEAHASYDAISGRIEGGWRIDGERIFVDAVIPPGATATVTLPVAEGTPVLEGGAAAGNAKGVTSLGAGPEGIAYSVGSGSYHFSAPLPPPPVRIESSSGVSVQVDGSNGSYEVDSRAPAWSFAGELGAPAENVSSRSGSDPEGPFHEVDFSWKSGVALEGYIRLYDATSVVFFGMNSEASATPDKFQFPRFSAFPQGLLPFSYAERTFAPHAFRLEKDGTPWLLFDPHGNAAILSPAANFMTASMIGDGKSSIGCGFNSEVTALPAHFSNRAILVLGRGINATWDAWGRALAAQLGVVRPPNDADTGLRYLGYWTDNGATYYYNYDLKIGYEKTLENLMAYYRREDLPVRTLQLDSWWYYKTLTSANGKTGKPKNPALPEGEWNRYGGLLTYEAHPAVFPDGLAAFQRDVGLPLITHNRWIDPASPYHAEYRISGLGAVDPRWWDHIMDYLHGSGVTTYEQDWLISIYANSPEFRSTPGVGEAFTDNMARAAKERGMAVQYCMPLPRHFLQGASYPNVTTIRPSSDRFDRSFWDDFLYTSRLAASVGIWPWTDVFMSSETDNLLISTLSGGMVGFGDALGKENAANLRMAARPDGVLVKPDAPLVPVDAMYAGDAKGRRDPMVAWTYTDRGGLRTAYVFSYARPRVPTTKAAGAQDHFTLRDGDFENQARFVPESLGLHGEVAILDVRKGTVAKEPANRPHAFAVAGQEGSFFEIAPVTESGVAFFGDEGKFVSTGSKRVPSLSADAGGITAEVRFAAAEKRVRIRGYAAAAPRVTAVRGSAGTPRFDPATGIFEVDLSPADPVEAESGGGDPVRSAVIRIENGG